MVQWLVLHASTAEGVGSTPGQGTNIPQARWYGQKKEKVGGESLGWLGTLWNQETQKMEAQEPGIPEAWEHWPRRTG